MEIELESLADSFILTLQESLKEQYSCFRTEVRDTGVFVCGLHKGERWFSEKSGCPEISAFSVHAINSFWDSIDRLNPPAPVNPSAFTKANNKTNKASSLYSGNFYSDDEIDLFEEYEEYS